MFVIRDKRPLAYVEAKRVLDTPKHECIAGFVSSARDPVDTDRGFVHSHQT